MFTRLKKIFNIEDQHSDYLFRKLENKPIDSDREVFFATGMSRSGTHFLAKVFGSEEKIRGYHLDEIGNGLADSFLMYCKWYNLPVDLGGFYNSRNHLILESQGEQKYFLESNPYLALSISDLKTYYAKSKFIITLRDPRKVVLSLMNKGWYDDLDPIIFDYNLAPGYQYQVPSGGHFFGRFYPKQKEEFLNWKSLSRVGKISWMWQQVNNDIKAQLKEMSSEDYFIIDIDTFDYDMYQKAMTFLNITSNLSEEKFNLMRSHKAGRLSRYELDAWGDAEERDFNEQVEKFKGF